MNLSILQGNETSLSSLGWCDCSVDHRMLDLLRRQLQTSGMALQTLIPSSTNELRTANPSCVPEDVTPEMMLFMDDDAISTQS